jgi:hypothetical protein
MKNYKILSILENIVINLEESNLQNEKINLFIVNYVNETEHVISESSLKEGVDNFFNTTWENTKKWIIDVVLEEIKVQIRVDNIIEDDKDINIDFSTLTDYLNGKPEACSELMDTIENNLSPLGNDLKAVFCEEEFRHNLLQSLGTSGNVISKFLTLKNDVVSEGKFQKKMKKRLKRQMARLLDGGRKDLVKYGAPFRSPRQKISNAFLSELEQHSNEQKGET